MTAGGATVGHMYDSTIVLGFHHLGNNWLNKFKNGILSTFLRKIGRYSLGKESSIGIFWNICYK